MADEHDWWTPDHPEDGPSWEEPQTAQRPHLRHGGAGGRRRRLAGIRHQREAIAVLALLALAAGLIVGLTGGGSAPVPGPPLPGLGHPARAGDPFGWRSGREASFAQRAAIGTAQVLFVKSPGGALQTAARVAAYRPLIDAAAKGSGVDPNVLEGLVFVESAGRPDVIAGTDPAAAAGLTQILAATGQSLLGMHIDLRQSRKLTGRIGAAAGNAKLIARLQRKRAAVDDRFVPAKALAATVRYLRIAHQRLGRWDLAVESYHMGIGNLQQVLSDYNGGGAVPYAQVFFDSSPGRNPNTYRLLQSFADDSRLYYWRVLGAVQIMRLYRIDPGALRRLSQLETSFPSNAMVLVPPDRVRPFQDAAALSAAYRAGQLLPLPSNARQLWLSYEPTIGSQAGALKVPRGLYSGLRPAALDMLIELAARVRAISHVNAPLTVASTVIDRRYEHRLGIDDPPALTGYTFQIVRHYASAKQADAFQAMLDRLQALNLIAWIRGSHTIEITVAPDADHVIAHGV